ncbi:MAG: DEAD/DEAH box helicase [Cycloclasticus sp.]|nr:DEAD/DEAH box helicase [Cycloclasticus sp.]
MKKNKDWKAPAIRANAALILDLAKKIPRVEMDDFTRDKLNEVSTASAPRPKEKFPIWYPWKTKPMPKQLEALDSAWGQNIKAFFCEQGTGKSKIYTDMASAMFMEGKINAMVVLTKYSLRRNICQEFEKHSPLTEDDAETFFPDFSLVSGRKKADAFLLKKKNFKMLSIGLESLSNGEKKGRAYEYTERFLLCHNALVVVDESHLIKGHQSMRTMNACSLGLLTKFRMIGTGTPISHGPLDFYSQFDFLDPNIIGVGDYYSFRNRYAQMGGYEGKEIVGYENIDELMEIIKPWVFQVTKKEMMPDLPPKVYLGSREVKMTKEQEQLYKKVKKEKVAEIGHLIASKQDTEVVAQNALVAYSLLQQIACGYISYKVEDPTIRKVLRQREWLIPPERNPKLNELIECLDDLKLRGRQANIWTRYQMEVEQTVDYINKKLGKGTAVKYYGKMTQEEKNVAQAEFVDGKVDFFIANQEAAGTGLTFVNAEDAYYLSNSFRYIDRVQSEDRNHRRGTVNKVFYTDIVCEKTVEVKVQQALAERKDMADFVRGQMADGIDLSELF